MSSLPRVKGIQAVLRQPWKFRAALVTKLGISRIARLGQHLPAGDFIDVIAAIVKVIEPLLVVRLLVLLASLQQLCVRVGEIIKTCIAVAC